MIRFQVVVHFPELLQAEWGVVHHAALTVLVPAVHTGMTPRQGFADGLYALVVFIVDFFANLHRTQLFADEVDETLHHVVHLALYLIDDATPVDYVGIGSVQAEQIGIIRHGAALERSRIIPPTLRKARPGKTNNFHRPQEQV